MKLKAAIPIAWAEQFSQAPPKKGLHVFAHQRSPLLEIHSPDPLPWGKGWSVLIGVDMNQTRKGIRYEKSAKLILYPLESEPAIAAAELELEIRKGKLFYCDRPNKPILVIPVHRTESGYYFLILWAIAANCS